MLKIITKKNLYSFSSKGREDNVILIKQKDLIKDTIFLFGYPTKQIYNDTDLVVLYSKFNQGACSLQFLIYFNRIVNGKDAQTNSIKINIEIDSSIILNQSDLLVNLNSKKNYLILQKTCDLISSCRIELKENKINFISGWGFKKRKIQYKYDPNTINETLNNIECEFKKLYPQYKYFYKLKREIIFN
jgi:hypothetical protein